MDLLNIVNLFMIQYEARTNASTAYSAVRPTTPGFQHNATHIAILVELQRDLEWAHSTAILMEEFSGLEIEIQGHIAALTTPAARRLVAPTTGTSVAITRSEVLQDVFKLDFAIAMTAYPTTAVPMFGELGAAYNNSTSLAKIAGIKDIQPLQEELASKRTIREAKLDATARVLYHPLGVCMVKLYTLSNVVLYHNNVQGPDRTIDYSGRVFAPFSLYDQDGQSTLTDDQMVNFLSCGWL